MPPPLDTVGVVGYGFGDAMMSLRPLGIHWF